MSLSTQEQILIETRIANEGPNIVVAYLFWFFLGFDSAHRFYLGKPTSAILQILSFLIVIGAIWWAIDLVLIPRLVRARQAELRQRYAYEGIRA